MGYGTGSGGGYGGGSSSGQKHHGNPLTGFVGHLANDIGEAGKGFFPGIAHLATHPVDSVEQMGKTTWHDWSPLLTGHPGKFAKQFYDHPLAPLLDVATVFSGGASIGAKLADAGKLGSADSALVKALRSGSDTITLKDRGLTKGGNLKNRKAQSFDTSSVNYKRAIQQKYWKFAGEQGNHLPQWFTPQGKFERLHVTRSVDRHIAMKRANKDAIDAYNLQIGALTQAGKTLDEAETMITPVILKHIFDGTTTHAEHFDDYVRHGNNKRVYHPGGQEPVYKALPDGWRYLERGDKKLLDRFEHNGIPIEDRLIHLGNVMTTDDPLRAARNAKGRALIVQSRDLHDLGIEARNSTIFLKKWYRYPTQVWKMALVGLSPKMVVDNAVGNWAMYAVGQMGHHSVRGLLDAYQQTKGIKRASSDLQKAARILNPHWMEKHFGQELGRESFFGTTIQDVLKGDDKQAWYQKGLYPLVHKYADQPVRRAAINGFMRSSSEVKTLMGKGMDYDTAVNHALKRDNGQLARRAVEHSRDIAGDYHAMTDTGRMVRDLVPFYLWDRHIARHISKTITEHPGRIALMQKMAHVGAEANKNATGDQLPSFLESLIPIGKTSDGRLKGVNTQGLNPYTSVGDLAQAFTAAVTGGQVESSGSTLGGLLNPVITNLFEAMAGRRFGTGAPVDKHGGVVPTAIVNMAESLPQLKLLEGLAHPHGHSNVATYKNGRRRKPKLYKNNLEEIISNMLGVPIKNVSLENAGSLHKKEGG